MSGSLAGGEADCDDGGVWSHLGRRTAADRCEMAGFTYMYMYQINIHVVHCICI